MKSQEIRGAIIKNREEKQAKQSDLYKLPGFCEYKKTQHKEMATL